MTEAEKIAITKYDLLYEQRMTRVETNLENMYKTIENMDRTMRDGFKEMKADFRWLFGVGSLFMGAILLVMARGFHWF